MEHRQEIPVRVEMLQEQIARLEQARRGRDDRPVPTGCVPLDQCLPQRGFRRGTLVEWLARGEGTGVQTLALTTAREACRRGGTLVVMDRRHEFYPPAAARLAVELQNLIVVHAACEADNAWALDQALRCPGVAAVLAWPEPDRGKLPGRTLRRWQLAAEHSGALGLLIRPESVRAEPSWADVRLLVEPLPVSGAGFQPAWQAGSLPHFNFARRLRIHLLRCHGTSGDRTVDVEIDDETRTVHLAVP